MEDFSTSARTRFLKKLTDSVAPALLWSGTWEVEDVIPTTTRKGFDVEVKLKVNNMLRPGANLAQATEKQYTTRTHYRLRTDLNAFPGNLPEGIFFSPQQDLDLDYVLSFANSYFGVNIKPEDVNMAYFRINQTPITLKMKDKSPFFKGMIKLIVI